MDDFRTGRVNALAYAIYESDGDPEELARRARFLPLDLTEDDIRYAVELAAWFRTVAGQESLAMCRVVQEQIKAERGALGVDA